MPKDMLIMLIINAILYPFTRFMYFLIKAFIFKNVNLKIPVIVYYPSKLFVFLLLSTAFITGSIAIIYILIVGNCKYYLEKKHEQENYIEEIINKLA